MGFLAGWQRDSPHQLGGLGSAVSSPRTPENLDFGAFLGPQKSRQNGQLALNLGESVPCPNVETPWLYSQKRKHSG